MPKLIKNKDLKIGQVQMTCDGGFEPPISEPLGSLGKSFFIACVGPPRSGKTNILLSLLKNKKAFYRRFDSVYWFSPSSGTIKDGLPIPDENQFEDYDPDIVDSIIDDINEDEERAGEDICLVFDDVVNSMKKNDRSFLRLAFNRRHLITGGSVNIIIITQKYNKLPLGIRTGLSGVILFKANTRVETKIINDELIDLDKEELNILMKVSYRKPHDFLFINLNSGDKNNKYYPNFNHLIFD